MSKAKPAKLAPKRKAARLKLRPGQPHHHSKLDNELEQKICNLIAGGLSRETAANLCGINRETIRQWQIKGQGDPDSRYGQFLRALQLADDQAVAMMVSKLLKHPDPKWTWKILKNKRPEEYNERLHIKAEHCGPDGSPIPVDIGKGFTVEIICPPPPPDAKPKERDDAEGPYINRAAAAKNGQPGSVNRTL